MLNPVTTINIEPAHFPSNGKLAMFTVSDAEYAPLALTMFDSLYPFYSEADFYLFVIGTGKVKLIQGRIHVVYINEIFDDTDLSQRLAFYLNVEMATSVRPQCFQYLFTKSYDRAFYLDPDLYVFRRMTEIDVLLESDINGVVTPHALKSVTAENRVGGDNVFLQCGIFNLGFLALKKSTETSRMLAWWAEKLKWQCLVDWPNGYFVDQKWLEFLPVYFDKFHILKLPTYNLAPWNSEHYRILTGSDEMFFIDDYDNPVAFIHYSGVLRAELHFMHMKEARLFYLRKLEKHRFSQFDLKNYTVRHQNGLFFDKVSAFLYKEFIQNNPEAKTINPLISDDFFNFMHEADGETGLSVYIRKLFEIMPDIFFGYLISGIIIDFDHLISEMKTNFTYITTANPQTMIYLRNNIVGEIFAHSGLVPEKGSLGDKCFSAVSTFRKSDNSTNLPSSHIRIELDRIDVTVGHVHVSIPFIDESGALPISFLSGKANYTEIWVPSSYVKESLVKLYPDLRITPIPYAISIPDFEVHETHVPEDMFVVMLRHDFSLNFDSQNTLASLQALTNAFRGKSDVFVVCFFINSEKSDAYEKLALLTKELENYVIVEGVDRSDIYYSWLNRAHCVISLHRSVAFGYALGEAVLLGKNVVATINSGNADFMNSGNCYIVESNLADGHAAEASRILTSIYFEIGVLNKMNKVAKLSIQRHLGAEAVGFHMQQRISDLQRLLDGKSSDKKVNPVFLKIKRELRRLFFGSPRIISPPLTEEYKQISKIARIFLRRVPRPAILE